MKKGFTLVELLVVISILGVLMVMLITRFKDVPKESEVAKCRSLVKQVETALVALHDRNDGIWPPVLRANSNKAAGLDEHAGYPLAAAGLFSLSHDGNGSLAKADRFGILSTWGATVVSRTGHSCRETTPVPVGGTIADHRLRYALDLDGDNIIDNVDIAGTTPGVKGRDGKTVSLRGVAAVWCLGPKGEVVKSWTDGQTKGVR